LTERLLSRWESLSTSVRNHLIGEILSRRSTTLRLLDALETKQISVNEIPLVFREQLLKTGTRSMRVRSQRLLSRATSTPRDQLVRTYLDAMENLPVDENSRPQSTAKIGATLFKKHCVTCHAEKSHAEKSHAADGNSESHAVDALGPSLANLSNRSRQALAESILDPNRAVEPKYQSFLVQTVDGRLLTGVIAAEVAGNLTIGHADGKRSTVPRDSIEAMKSSGVSLMPEGFEKNLSPAELLAVIRYVQTM
jgi:putative heme-binding domain-containing protein